MDLNLIKNLKKYDEHSVKEYIFEADVNYHKRLHDFHSDLPFSPGKNENWKM